MSDLVAQASLETRDPEILEPVYSCPSFHSLSSLQSPRRTDERFAQVRKFSAIFVTLCSHIASIIDVTIDQFIELLRRRIADKVPEIRRLPVDRDAGGVGHAGTWLALRGPRGDLALGPWTRKAVRYGAEVGESAYWEVIHSRTRGLQVEILGDVVEVLGGGVEEFGDEGVGGVVAWEGG